MRLGLSDHAIVQAGLIGRKKVGQLRHLADRHGFLDLYKPPLLDRSGLDCFR